MNLRTELVLPRAATQMRLGSRVVTVGSCFANVLGEQLTANKVQTSVNPFGTVFNPLSIFKNLGMALGNDSPTEVFFVKQADLWLHHDFHSSFWATHKDALNERIVASLRHTRGWLLNADFVVVTLGTAWAYRHKESQRIASNCHKVPSRAFDKQLLGVAQIEVAFADFYQKIRLVNPNVKVILTVSPVRHTRDTLPLNAVSKAILRLACHQITEAHQAVSYFPSYELMLDDLRDYRFYKPDLIHPNEVAEKFIFERFGEVYFEQPLQDFVADWAKIRAAMAHRPTLETSESYRVFLKNLLLSLEKIQSATDLSQEFEWVNAKLRQF